MNTTTKQFKEAQKNFAMLKRLVTKANKEKNPSFTRVVIGNILQEVERDDIFKGDYFTFIRNLVNDLVSLTVVANKNQKEITKMTNQTCPTIKQMNEDELQYNEVKKEVVVALSTDNIDTINAVVAHINNLLAHSEAHKTEYRNYLVQLNDKLVQVSTDPIDEEFKNLKKDVLETLNHMDSFELEMREYELEGFMLKTSKYDK